MSVHSLFFFLVFFAARASSSVPNSPQPIENSESPRESPVSSVTSDSSLGVYSTACKTIVLMPNFRLQYFRFFFNRAYLFVK